MKQHVLAIGLTIGATLALAACGVPGASTPSQQPSAPSQPPRAAQAVDVGVADFEITPVEIEVSAGDTTFDVTNHGPTPHNLTIRTEDGDVVSGTPSLRRHEMQALTVALEPGQYVTFCSLPGHESLGMRGTLVVEAP